MTHALGYGSRGLAKKISEGEAKLILWPRPDPSATLAAAWLSDWIATSCYRPHVIFTSPLEEHPEAEADGIIAIGHKIHNAMDIAAIGYEPYHEVARTDGLAVYNALRDIRKEDFRRVSPWAVIASDVWDISRLIRDWPPCLSPTYTAARQCLFLGLATPEEELHSIASFLSFSFKNNCQREIADYLSCTLASDSTCVLRTIMNMLPEKALTANE